jgi:hypothetical protein
MTTAKKSRSKKDGKSGRGKQSPPSSTRGEQEQKSSARGRARAAARPPQIPKVGKSDVGGGTRGGQLH